VLSYVECNERTREDSASVMIKKVWHANETSEGIKSIRQEVFIVLVKHLQGGFIQNEIIERLVYGYFRVKA
jgi:hypothetical protein